MVCQAGRLLVGTRPPMVDTFTDLKASSLPPRGSGRRPRAVGNSPHLGGQSGVEAFERCVELTLAVGRGHVPHATRSNP